MHTDSTPKGDLQKLQRGLLTEADARAMLERIRWPNGVHCIFSDCGGAEIYRIEAKASVRKDGRTVAPRHLYKCKACKRQFSVTKGTIFEDSKISLVTWIQVMYRMCSSKKGISAYQIHREYGLNYEAAWFMCHRIRWAMTEKNASPFSGIVEVDETYVGGRPRGPKKPMKEATKDAWGRKTQVLGMLERGGRVRAGALSKRGERISTKEIHGTILANVDPKATRLMSDEHGYYMGIERHLPHGIIRHRSEYVRGEVHTQGIESFWAGLMTCPRKTSPA